MARKRRKNKEMPCLVLTLETVNLVRAALQCLEEPLRRANPRNEKVVFATETMTRVKGKLDAMSTSLGHLLLTSFDANEKVILVAALQIYSLDLRLLPFTPRRERELQRCRQIEAYFAPPGNGKQETGEYSRPAE